jgi:ankyrin repeat protein
LKSLISHGADIHATDNIGRTPLHLATGHNTSLKKLQYLVSTGADVNAKDDCGKIPLDYADTEDKKHVLREAMAQG